VALDKLKKQQDDTETALYAANKKICGQQEEIYELYDLQVQKFTKKQFGDPRHSGGCLRIIGGGRIKISTSNDIEISHKLNTKGKKAIIVKFQIHKVKSKLYRERRKLKHIAVSDLFPNLSAATVVQAQRIFLNDNLTSYRRRIMSRANEMRRGELVSAWSMDG